MSMIYYGQGIPWADIPKFRAKKSGEYMGNVAYAFEVSSSYLSCNAILPK
jgi:hypothetical protein